MNKLKLGSLFDGSGGFPLGALLTGITPLWASEIEPFPICVTRKNIPQMKHLGDISKLDGAKVEPVDIITFGSPCTNLSIAGKCEGLDGKQSSLFFEAIRIIKEMRNATNGKYPRYAVWENVMGAFSSNHGEDFRTVLESIAKINDERLSIPRCDKWTKSGVVIDDRYSIAWRSFDSQFFGVPQRRKRIYLIADFNGQCADKILFNTKSLPRDFKESICSWQKTTEDTRNYTEKASNDVVFENHGQDCRYKKLENIAPTVSSNYGTGGNNQPFVVSAFDIRQTSENTKNSRHNVYESNISRTVDTSGIPPNSNQGGIALVYALDRESFNSGQGFARSVGVSINGINSTLNAQGPSAVGVPTFSMTTGNFMQVNEDKSATLASRDYKDPPVVNTDYVIRRLTPTECCRLQGFPDFWCADLEIENPTVKDIIFWRDVFETPRKVMDKSTKAKTDKQIVKWLKNPYSDSAEYKMWGNGVALPCVYFVLHSIVLANKNEDTA